MNNIFTNSIFKFPILICLFFCFSSIYIFAFKKIIKKKVIPTGSGIILPSFLVISLENFYQKNSFFYSILIIFFNSLLYFIDDIKNLKPYLRILISIFTGVSLLFVNSQNSISLNFSSYIFLNYLFIVCLTCLLVNVLNFYDGSDLNLCSIILFSGLILLVSNNYVLEYSKSLGAILISFSVGFGILNSKPKNIYLGDSGSFAVAALIIFIFISSLKESNYLPVEFIALLALPIFDVLYVILLRIINNHNLLTRNFLHLYQRIQIRYKYFYYLVPNILNFFIFLVTFKILNNLSNNLYFSLFLCSFVFTPLVYLTIRKIYVEPKYFFGDGT